MNDRLVDILGQTARNKRLYIRNDCDGSPLCCAEIHIESTEVEDAFKWQEFHATYEEAKAIRKALKIAMREHKAGVQHG